LKKVQKSEKSAKNEVISKTIEIIDNISAVRIILYVPGSGFWPDFGKKAKKSKKYPRISVKFCRFDGLNK